MGKKGRTNHKFIHALKLLLVLAVSLCLFLVLLLLLLLQLLFGGRSRGCHTGARLVIQSAMHLEKQGKN